MSIIQSFQKKFLNLIQESKKDKKQFKINWKVIIVYQNVYRSEVR